MCTQSSTQPFVVRKKLERMVWEAALLLHLASLAAASGARDIALPRCQAKCGNVSIPYPFGIGEGCFLEGFEITCNKSFNNTLKPFLGGGNIVVEEIQLLRGLVIVNYLIARECYSKDGSPRNGSATVIWLGEAYRFSNTRNKFVAIGCDTIGHLKATDSGYETGCLSVCDNTTHISNGTCSGFGCCEAVIPKELRSFEVSVSSFRNHIECWDFNNCSYGFLADEERLNFNLDSFSRFASMDSFPVTLDWAVGDKSCKEARDNRTSFACKAKHSYCVNSTNGGGYRCRCSKGFKGNPYLEDGCQDIDECASSPCVERCKNTLGSYTCSCRWHMYGDGRKNGSGCKSMSKFLHWALGAGFGLLILAVLSSWLYLIIKKRRHIKLKEKFFRKNGGLLLQQQISSLEGSAPVTRMFTKEELIEATDNYMESRILGQGGAGTVYKGILLDKSIVAIKKSRISDNNEIEQFINEVVVLSQINHRNVVKLLGCCLETRVPLLVFEFAPNGTLSNHLHDEGRKASLSLECRLRIAAEVAGALAYLHSEASVPIIHRDVKPSNILLDENYTAKVSDFGTSRLVPFNQKGLESLIRGTFGYVDPEYFLSGMFTDKSDVYSFGVVLVELLTGEKPVVPTKSLEFTNLAMQFNSHVKEGRLLKILEEPVLQEGSPELLGAVAELAIRCLRLKGEERPAMKEVAIDLEGLRTSIKHPWVEKNGEDGDHLLMVAECSTSGTFGEGDSSTHIIQSLDISR